MSQIYADITAHDTLTPNAAWSVGAWWIDPVSGNDGNNGTSSGTPLKTWQALVALWGTTAPVLSQNTTVTFLSSQSGTGDPVIAEPLLVSGTNFILTAGLPAASFTGTLNTVTAKNRASNQALQSTFTTTTGAIAANMLLVNTTRGNSRAFVQRNVSGGNWQISQPLTPYPGSGSLGQTEVDTWASGDAINGYVLVGIDLVKLGGQVVDTNSSLGAGVVLWQVQVQEPTSGNFGFDTFVISAECTAFITECNINRSLSANGRPTTPPQFANVTTQGFNTVGNGAFITGGILGGTLLGHGVTIASDAIISGSGTYADCGFQSGVCVDTSSVVITAQGNCQNAGGAAIYGAGKINVQEGCFRYTSGTASTNFPLSGGLRLNNLTTACSLSTSGVLSGISLTAANLDASAGSAGFGGLAFIPGGPCITNGTVPSGPPYIVTTATGLTSDSSAHTLATITLPASPGVTILEVQWIARDTITPANDTCGKIAGGFRNASGTATQIGSTSNQYTFGSSASLAFTVSSNTVLVQGTGDGASTEWTLVVDQINSAA